MALLILAAVLGFGAGLLRGNTWRHLMDLPMRWGGVALTALSIQLFAMRHGLDGGLVLGTTILASQALLVAVIWANRHCTGFSILGAGLILNLLTMAANGGFMPVSPESVTRLAVSATPAVSGVVLPASKSIVLTREATRLWLLSDVFVLPPPFPVPSAFSLGDALIAIGMFLIPRSVKGRSDLKTSLATERLCGGRSESASSAGR